MNQNANRQASIQRLWTRGEDAVKRKDWRVAAKAFDEVIALEPGHLPALLKSSGAHLRLDHYRLARDLLLRAVPMANGHPGLTLELGRMLRQFHEPAILIELIRKTAFIERGHPGMLTEMALIVSSVGAQETALELVSRATAMDPAYDQAHYLRGTVLMFLGRMEEAETELEHCLRLAPAHPQAHWVLAGLRKWPADGNHVARIRAQLARTAARSSDEAYLSFALHKELHDAGEYAEAWEALQRGSRAKRKLDPYDPERVRRLFAEVKSVCAPGFAAGAGEARADDYTPIFIVGMHRSGTTLLERILGGHSQVADGGETYAFTAQLKIAADHKTDQVLDLETVAGLRDADFDAIGRGFIEGSRWRTKGKPFLTEKLPPNFINAGFIARALPGARILHMVRDPMDTCFSNLRTYFSNAALYSFDPLDMADFFALYADLMAHWRTVMPGRVLDIAYDDLVGDTEATARGIFDFCGLPFEAEALDVERASGAVSTASSAHVRQGILKDRGAAWKAYESELAPMLERLTAHGLMPRGG